MSCQLSSVGFRADFAELTLFVVSPSKWRVQRKIRMMENPHRKVRIKLEHRVQYPDAIRVSAGEKVSVGREDKEFPGWKLCKAADGREGWVPVELLSNEGAEAIVAQDYSARELAVRPGEEVMVEDNRHDWLLVRNAKGERGWIPASHIEPLEG